MEARSNIAVTPDKLHGVKKSRRRRGRRGGQKVQLRRIAAIQRETGELQAQEIALDTSIPVSAGSRAEPEVITIDDSDDDTIAIPIPPPPIEIVDTDSALKVRHHYVIPDKVPVSYIRNFAHDTPETVPHDIAQWCSFVYLTQ